jgi:uncharacterized protein (TIRG00374 family)
MTKTWVRLTLILFSSLFFLYFFFRSVEWKEVFRYLSSVRYSIFVIVILLMPVHFATRAFRWKYLLMTEKKDVKFSNMFAGNVVGFTVTCIFPGRMGELVRPFYLANKEKMRKGFVLATIVVERVFDIFTMCFLLGVFLITKPTPPRLFTASRGGYSKLRFLAISGGAFVCFLLVVILALYLFKERTFRLIAFFLRFLPQKIAAKILVFTHEFIDGLRCFHTIGNLLIYVLLSFFVWLVNIFWYWLFFFAYNINVGYFFMIPYVCMVIIGASIPTPGMVGGYHYFSKLSLTAFYGVDPNAAIGITIISHAVQVAITCAIGFGILWRDGLSLFRLQKIGEDAGL